MKVFVFTSSTMTNIWAGVGAQTWAVRKPSSESTKKGLITKASKMPVGAFGLLYSSADKRFTCPFVVNSPVDRDWVVTNIWPEPAILPFAIRTLGNPHLSLSWTEAGNLLPSCVGGRPLSKLINVEPGTAFVGNELHESDWAAIVSKLASPPDFRPSV
jgi:hypothetical protein